MTLTLEIVGPQAAQLGAAARKTFVNAGGSIGRAANNDWVIPDAYISGHHARVHFRDGRYLLEDTSTNGVFVKNPGNRLPKGQMHSLQTGDRVFIDAYEIKVTITTVAESDAGASLLNYLFTPSAAVQSALAIPDDPFAVGDPVVSASPAPKPATGSPAGRPPSASGRFPAMSPMGEDLSGDDSVDPLALLGLGPKVKPGNAPKAADLAGRSPLSDHYAPPDLTTPLPEPSGAVADALIPDDYDPLNDARPAHIPSAPPAMTVRPTPGGTRGSTVGAKPVAPATPANSIASSPSAKEVKPVQSPPAKAPPVSPAKVVIPPAMTPPPVAAKPAASVSAAPRPAATTADSSPSMKQRALNVDLAALLSGAGMAEANVSPELAESLGRILQVVVAGMMDILRSRERIKDEFRMRMTSFKVADNNPLKFSANVDDALHNMLVKRNAAYLGPVEAFEDAFRDVRHHQMAMLAGMRTAFDAMLQNFEPEQLQERFSRESKRGALLAVPAKLRYWELYRERFHDMVKDPEASFRELFGEEFARAYEEQLERLKVAERHQK